MKNAALLLLLISTVGRAEEAAQPPTLEDIMHARNYAMGGAYRSLGYGAESITGNPAALSVFKRYQLELSGAYDFKNTWAWGGIAIADSITNELAGGASYQMATLGNGATRRTAFLTTVASALPLGQLVHLGVAIRHQVITGFNETNSITMNAGVIFKPFDELTVSVSGNNLIGVYNSDVPRFFSFALSSLLFGQFTPAVELKADFNDPKAARFAFSGGAEWLIANSFPIRLGYSRDWINHTQHIGMGIGYFNEGSGIDISYRHEIGGTEGRLLAATIKIQFN